MKTTISGATNPIINEGFIASNDYYSSTSDSNKTHVNTISEIQPKYKKNAVDGTGREFDLCLVLKNNSFEEKCVFNIIIDKLQKAKFQLYIFPSALHIDSNKKRTVKEVQGTFHRDTMTFDSDAQITESTLIFVLIRAEVQELKQFADSTNFKMMMNAKTIEKIATDGIKIVQKNAEEGTPPEKVIKPFTIGPGNPDHRKNYDSVFLQSAIPEDRTCNPFYCKKLTTGLTREQVSLLPYGK